MDFQLFLARIMRFDLVYETDACQSAVYDGCVSQLLDGCMHLGWSLDALNALVAGMGCKVKHGSQSKARL